MDPMCWVCAGRAYDPRAHGLTISNEFFGHLVEPPRPEVKVVEECQCNACLRRPRTLGEEEVYIMTPPPELVAKLRGQFR
jgi:hypothetical protein